MLNVMMRRTGLLLLTGLAGVTSFSVHQHHLLLLTTASSSKVRFDTAIASAGDPEFMSALLVAGSAAAAFQEYRTDKFDAVKEFTKTHTDHMKEEIDSIQAEIENLKKKKANGKVVPAKKTEPVVVVEEVVAKVEGKVEEKPEEKPAPAIKETVAVKEPPKPAPAPAPVKRMPIFSGKAPAPPAPAPVPAPEPIRKTVPSPPHPVAVTMTKPEPAVSRSDARSASDSLTDLVKQVGKTVEQNREMEDLVKARRQKQEAEEIQDDEVEKQAVTAVLTKETIKGAPPKKRGLIRKAWRVTKKVVAPWRKWENIS